LRARRLGLFEPVPSGTDLPVLLPVDQQIVRRAERERGLSITFRLQAWHGAVLVLVLVCAAGVAEAQSQSGHPGIIATLIKWTPLLFRGFGFNLFISFVAIVVGTSTGLILGLAQISRRGVVRSAARLITHFFRNAPWLVLLFYCMYLLPIQVRVGGLTIPLPDWVKATLGFALPAMANVSEIVRGAVQSIPTGQWESASALAFTRRQTIWMIILPQCVKRMLPPWMNLYSILTMATVLASIVGVSEVMTLAGEVLSAENRPELLLPMYGYILIWFFLYCYPIARWTVRLERKFGVNM
jgi:polar amino acid transport system permease protein